MNLNKNKGGYIGESTQQEIDYAKKMNKQIYYYEHTRNKK